MACHLGGSRSARAATLVVTTVARNRVADIRYAGFLTVCCLLRELVLAENPCAARPGYRATIRDLLPVLAALDGVPLGSYQQDGERSRAKHRGNSLRHLIL